MSFSLTCRQVGLRGSWLVAMAQKLDASWTFSKINLNEHIGNDDGEFDVTGHDWFDSAKRCRLQGAILFAQLRTRAGSYASETCVNLDLFVENKDGRLTFRKLSDSILLSAMCFTLNGASLLEGIVVGRNGKLYPSSIDLNQHYGNIRGEFRSGERHYSWTGRNFRLKETPKAIMLVGKLGDGNGVYRNAEVDLSICIVNKQGHLGFVKHDGWFERDHWLTKLAESAPVLGYAIAGLHYLGGNEDHCYRAIAKCTYSTIVTAGVAIGALVGAAFASPVLGSILGAGLATPLAIFAETSIAALIDDPRVRADIATATIERYIYETLRNMLVTGAGAGFAALVGARLGPWIDKCLEPLKAWLARKGLNFLADLSLSKALKRVLDALCGEERVVSEWFQAEMELTKIIGPYRWLLQPKYDDLPVEGRHYAIKIYGTQKALTCVNQTELRLQTYDGRDTQRFRCTNYDGHTGFICVGADHGKGRYLGFNAWETLACQAWYQRTWEHFNIVPESGGGHKLWMVKDDHFAPVSRVSDDKLKMMATSETRFSFHALD